jgi:hypothetical protein
VNLEAFGVEVGTACWVGKRLGRDVVGGGRDWSYVVIIFQWVSHCLVEITAFLKSTLMVSSNSCLALPVSEV